MISPIVTALVVMIMFAVMIGPAAAFDYSIGKSTLTEPGGEIDNGLEYVLGQQVNYSMTFTPTSESCTITSVKDIFPDGTEETLASGSIPLDKDEVIGWETTWVVNGGGIGSDGTIVNYLEIKGYDADCQSFIATAPKSSNIIVTIAFTYAATCCMGATVTPEWSGPVAWHQWIIDGTTYPVIYTAPTPKDLTSCGSYVVTLKGGPDIGDLNNYKEFSDTVDIACEPIVEVKTDVTGCAKVGDLVEFSIDSLTYDTPIASYHWTFTNGLASSNNPTVTRTIPVGGTIATLKVTDDLGCYDSDTVSVSICPPIHKPTSDVPILTPTGMVALIGMLCIVGAGRILTKGRRS